MPQPRRVNRYEHLAKYGDLIFEFAEPVFAQARERVLGRILPAVESACDLACGTGSTAVALAGRGIRTYAVDHSPAACRATREKARRAGVSVRLLCADMRDFQLPEPVDLVTCEFDALNHVPEKADLHRVASAVSAALKPGGRFYFDVNNRLAFEEMWPDTWWHDKGDVAVVMHGGYDRQRDRAWSEIEWFIREGRLWRRRHERVEEVCWTPAEIRTALRQAGFGRIRTLDGEALLPGIHVRRGHRTFCLARKG